MGPEVMAPDYEKGIRISMETSLGEMLAPGALVFLAPAGRWAGLREGLPRRSALRRAALEHAAGDPYGQLGAD